MKNILKKLAPKTTWGKVNLVLTGVLFLAFAGNLYMRSVTPPAGPLPPCPQSGEAFFPHSQAMNWYFHCIDGVPLLKECPPYTAFREDLNACFFDSCYWSLGGTCTWGVLVTPGGNSVVEIPDHANWQ